MKTIRISQVFWQFRRRSGPDRPTWTLAYASCSDCLRGEKKTRVAFSIVELIAAIMVVSLCLVAFAKIAHLAGQQRLIHREHQTAVDQTLNVLEYLVAANPEQLAAAEIDLMPHETLIARTLPDGKLLVTCMPLQVGDSGIETTVGTWQLDATVSWSPGANIPRRNVTFTRLLSKQFEIETAEETETTPEETVTENTDETAAGNAAQRSDRIETPLTETTPEGGEE